MPSLSADSTGFTLSKHAPVKSLGISKASKAEEWAGLATKAPAMKPASAIYTAVRSRSCAGPKARDGGGLKCQVTAVRQTWGKPMTLAHSCSSRKHKGDNKRNGDREEMSVGREGYGFV